MLIIHIEFLFAELVPVQRRLSEVHVPAFNQLRHLAIEESEQESSYVRSIHVRVSHNDDTVIAQLLGIVFFLADTASQRRDERCYLRRGKQLVEARFLDIQNLAL